MAREQHHAGIHYKINSYMFGDPDNPKSTEWMEDNSYNHELSQDELKEAMASFRKHANAYNMKKKQKDAEQIKPVVVKKKKSKKKKGKNKRISPTIANTIGQYKLGNIIKHVDYYFLDFEYPPQIIWYKSDSSKCVICSNRLEKVVLSLINVHTQELVFSCLSEYCSRCNIYKVNPIIYERNRTVFRYSGIITPNLTN